MATQRPSRSSRSRRSSTSKSTSKTVASAPDPTPEEWAPIIARLNRLLARELAAAIPEVASNDFLKAYVRRQVIGAIVATDDAPPPGPLGTLRPLIERLNEELVRLLETGGFSTAFRVGGLATRLYAINCLQCGLTWRTTCSNGRRKSFVGCANCRC
jgi:hypothetical protein